MRIINMALEQNLQTTIAISRRNHLELSALCKKGESYDHVLTQILNELKKYKENGVGQSKFGIKILDSDCQTL